MGNTWNSFIENGIVDTIIEIFSTLWIDEARTEGTLLSNPNV